MCFLPSVVIVCLPPTHLFCQVDLVNRTYPSLPSSSSSSLPSLPWGGRYGYCGGSCHLQCATPYACLIPYPHLLCVPGRCFCVTVCILPFTTPPPVYCVKERGREKRRALPLPSLIFGTGASPWPMPHPTFPLFPHLSCSVPHLPYPPPEAFTFPHCLSPSFLAQTGQACLPAPLFSRPSPPAHLPSPTLPHPYPISPYPLFRG